MSNALLIGFNNIWARLICLAEAIPDEVSFQGAAFAHPLVQSDILFSLDCPPY